MLNEILNPAPPRILYAKSSSPVLTATLVIYLNLQCSNLTSSKTRI